MDAELIKHFCERNTVLLPQAYVLAIFVPNRQRGNRVVEIRFAASFLP